MKQVNPIVRRLWSLGLTLNDIARLKGVSHTLVSLSLSGHRNSKKAKEIRAYVQQLLDSADKQAV